MRRFFVTVMVVASGCLCRGPALTRLQDAVRAPATVDCGTIVLGASATVAVAFDDVGQTTVSPISWAVAPELFALLDAPTQLTPGTSTVTVKCTPTALGVATGTLRLIASTDDQLTVALTMTAVPPPACTPSDACHSSTWSPSANACVETPLPDATPCPAQDHCLVSPTCQSGRCVGTALSCDDGDACTNDVCQPDLGCVHVPRTCVGDGICQAGACDRVLGCVLTPSPDGQPCGPNRSCAGADVCLAGQCVTKAPPDGFVCVEASPCTQEGHCENQVCVSPPALVLEPTWQFQLPDPDGGPAEAWSDLLVSTDGGVGVSSYFLSLPTLDVNRVPTALAAAARRCIRWREGLVCADYPTGSTVSFIDASGATRWSYVDVRTDLPLFAGPSVDAFLARLVAVSEDQVAAVFESRTNNPDGSDPRCRRFGIVTFDAQGHRLAMAMISHPIFDTCNHPHSYGVAADTTGHLYFAFTPSQTDNPATAMDGTVLMRYSQSLSLDWVTVEPGLVGGELAVARGTVFHERASRVWSAASGLPLGDLPVPFGFGVVARDVILPAPAEGATQAVGVDPVTLALKWSQPLPAAAGGPISLATMKTSFGDRTVMLAFTGDAGARLVSGTDVANGAALFTCPIDLPERPVQSALTPGQLTVMSGPRPTVDGFPVCDQCDPRWARTRNVFRTWSTPQLTPASAPWPGAWGGIGHDHAEDPVP